MNYLSWRFDDAIVVESICRIQFCNNSIYDANVHRRGREGYQQWIFWTCTSGLYKTQQACKKKARRVWFTNMGVLVVSSLLFATIVATRGASFSQPPNANPLSVTCEVQDGNYCRALCNDVVLDISNVFTYPWVLWLSVLKQHLIPALFVRYIELLLLVMTTATCIHPVMEPTALPTSPLTSR